MKWITGKIGAAKGVYTATIGEGPLALHAYVKNDGPGQWHWWISPANNDYAAEHSQRLEGVGETLRAAKQGVEVAVEEIIRNMAWSIGLEVGP